MNQALRMAPESGQVFAGHRLNRAQKVTFRLDGIAFTGFGGDTVLSALLANGVTAAGGHAGSPIALTPAFAPHIVRASEAAHPNYRMPMAHTPVRDGDEFLTVGGRPAGGVTRAAHHVLGRRIDRLFLSYDTPSLIPEPLQPEDRTHCGHFDVVVIGAGVAGLSAALSAARQGDLVALVERRPYAGGDAALFGQVEGELPPGEQVAELVAALERHANVRMFFSADARTFSGTTVEAVQITESSRGSKLSGIGLGTERVVLATGCDSALNLFPGNRLPGIMGLGDAFHLASAYAVSPAQPAIIAGATNAMYRFGLLARDAGMDIVRILDARTDPRSRFREFAKAYGISLVTGTQVAAAEQLKGGRLSLSTRLAWSEHGTIDTGKIETAGLITAAGWLPRLALWHGAGGALSWGGNTVSASGALDGVELAGSAAGYLSTAACVQSGERAMALLFGRTPEVVEETVISELFESDDGLVPPVETRERGLPPAYLGSQTSLALATSLPTPARLKVSRRSALDLLAGVRWLSQDDIQTLVHLGRVSTSQAARLLAERAIHPTLVSAEPVPKFRDQPPSAQLPAYLAARFGADAVQRRIETGEERWFEPGMLIFANSDETAPGQSVGVITHVTGDAQFAVIDRSHATRGDRLALRNGGATFPIWVAGPAES